MAKIKLIESLRNTQSTTIWYKDLKIRPLLTRLQSLEPIGKSIRQLTVVIFLQKAIFKPFSL